MKNFKFNVQFFIIAVTVLSVCGACDKNDKDPDTLSADISKIIFTADDTVEKSITVTSNTTWTSSKPESWIETKQTDNKLYVKVKNYTNTSSSRTGTITLSAGEALPVTVTIEQAAKEINSLTVSPTSLEYYAKESNPKTVSVTTNTKEGWNATTETSWITVSKKDKAIEVKVAENKSSSERTGSIKVTSGNAPGKTITVKQAAETTLSVSPKSLDFGSGEGVKDITVTTNANEWTSSKTASWITLTKQSNKLSVAVSENTSTTERSSSIKISANEKEVTVNVTQVAKTSITISTSLKSLSFTGNNPEEKYIQVTTNASTWTATTPVSWLTLKKIGQSLSVNATTNSITVERSATITFTADNGKATATVSVLQAALQVVLPTSANYRASGTPELLSTLGGASGPSTWDGKFLNVSGQRYSITGWGGKAITSFLNYDISNKKFIIDHTTVVTSDASTQIKGYFIAFIVTNKELLIIHDYSIPYNSSTGTIDFGCKIGGSDVLIGVIGVKGSIEEKGIVEDIITECYANAKIVFDVNTRQMENDTETRSMNFSGEKVNINSKSIKKIVIKSINDF